MIFRIAHTFLAIAMLMGCSGPLRSNVENGRITDPENRTSTLVDHKTPPKAIEVSQIYTALANGDLVKAETILSAITSSARSPINRTLASELRVVIGFLSGQTHGFDAKIRRLLKRHLTIRILVGLAPVLQGHSLPGSYVHTRLMLHRLHTDGSTPNVAQAKALEKAVKKSPFGRALKRVIHRKAQLDRPARKNAIGVLIPLSGPLKTLGQISLRAIKMAKTKLRKYKISLIIRDTHSDPTVTARELDKLVYENRVVGIIGPIGTGATIGAVRRATELGVPIIPFSSLEGITQPNGQVFRTRLTRHQEGISLARYAVRRMRIRRFGILLSKNPYSWAFASAFWNEVVKLGGEVVSVWTYPRGTRRFKKIVKEIAKSRRRPGGLKSGGLLIADTFFSVRRIRPYFPGLGIPIRRNPGSRSGLQLLGGSAWNNPLVVDKSEMTTDNAIFTDSYFLDENNSRVMKFAMRYKDKFSEWPTTFAAEAYDATQIMIRAVHGNRDGSRSGLLSWLHQMKSFDGVTGAFHFDKTGESTKEVLILTIDRDEIRLRNSEMEERHIRRGRR
jgi:branched-chain amino acid transport system substrate-binding protein